MPSRAGREPGGAGLGFGHERPLPVREFRSHRGGLAEPFGVQHGRAVSPQAGLRERRELRGERLGGSQRLAGGHDPVGEPDRGGLGGVDGTSGEDHVHRPAGADQAGQAHGPAIDERHAPASAEDAKDGGFVGHPQVAPQGQFEAAGHRVARHGGDHRLGQPQSADAHRPVAVGTDPVAALGADRGEVGPGAEHAAFAVEHGDRGLRIGVELPERGGEQRGGRPIDGVAARGAVQEDGGDRPRSLNPDGLIGHALLRFSSRPDRSARIRRRGRRPGRDRAAPVS